MSCEIHKTSLLLLWEIMDIKLIKKNMTQFFIIFGCTIEFFVGKNFSIIDYNVKILCEE